MNKIAVCPGSYDPITLGHVDIVKRAARIFGSAEVVVMNNSDKKYLFDMDKRYEIACAAFEDEKNIKVYKYSGMLYEYLSGRTECVLVKGVRDPSDFEYEVKMAEFNLEHSGTETLFLPASERFSSLSSTFVRQIMMKNGDLKGYVPENTVKFLGGKL